MGYIYLIKNNVNNKVYIGQTIRTINKRWQGHVYLVGKSNKELYKDMEIYGIHSFTIKEIEKCENSKLNDREKYYIRLYDSFNNGYNNTLGGSGSSTSNITDELILNIIDDIDNISIKELCIKYNISSTTLKQIRFEYGILTDIDITYTNEKHSIIMYDDTFDKGVLFESKLSALKYLGVDYRNFYREVGIACQNGNVVYGHRWQLASDLVYEDKIFRTKFDKEAYIQGKPAYQPEGKKYWIVDGAVSYTENIKSYCINCGIEISKGSIRCINCYKKYIKSTSKSDIKPDKDVLKLLLEQHSYEAIGRMYNVTGKAVRKWADSYNLVKSRPIDRTGVTCVELNMKFNTIKEAAEYLIQNDYTSATNIKNVAYNISKAKKNNNKYLGFNWK